MKKSDSASLSRCSSKTGWVARIRWRDAAGYILIPVLLVCWQLAWEANLFNRAVIPSPLDLVNTFVELSVSGVLLDNILASFRRVAVGYGLAILIGVPLGLALGRLSILRGVLFPLIELIRPIPPLAWVPLAIVLFGIGDGPAYFIVFLAAVFPIFVNSLDGALSIDSVYLRASQCLGFSKFRTSRQVIWPASLPQVMTGLKVGAGISWMAVVGAEMIAARSGLGYMIYEGGVLLRTDYIIAGMIVVGVLGILTSGALNYMQQRVLHWRG